MEMLLSPSRQAANYTAIQDFPSPLWNPKVYCRVYKSYPLGSLLSQISPFYITTSYVSKTLCDITNYLRLGLSNNIFPCNIPINIPFAFPLPVVLHSSLISSSLI
jgi:hypothetical protein